MVVSINTQSQSITRYKDDHNHGVDTIETRMRQVKSGGSQRGTKRVIADTVTGLQLCIPIYLIN